MTFTGSTTSGGNEGEIQINKSGGTTTTDPNLTFDQLSKSLTVSGKIEQKVANLTLVNQYALGSVKGVHFEGGGNIFVTSGNTVLKLDDQGNTLYSVTLTGQADQVLNDGIEIYVLTTSTNTISVLNQELNVISIISDAINLPTPTRFIRYGKFLFIACGAKLSKFDTTTKSITSTFTINSDTFVDLAMKGSELITLRQTSVSHFSTETLTLVKNVPNSNIINPRRIKATRNNVFVLCSSALLTFDTLLKYQGKRTTGLSDASTLSIYGTFLIVSNSTGGLSIYDASTIPSTLLNTIAVQVSPNTFESGLIVGSYFYLTDSLSGNLFRFAIDGIVAGGIKAGSAEITSIESSEINVGTVTATNINTANFYTSGSIIGTSGTLGGITLGSGVISGTTVQIDSGLQSLVMDSEGFKYINNSETVVQFKNNGTFESASIETEIFKISNGVNKLQISASPDLTADQTLIFPSTGGAAGDMLSNNGSGTLVWRAIDPSEITIPGGFNSHIQFNVDGVFSGSSKFKWDDDTEILSIGETGEITLGHDETTTTSTLKIGKAQTVQDATGTRIEILDVSNAVKLVADYNTTDGATISLGTVVISETGITGLSTPTGSTDAASKSYVDAASSVAGNSFWKSPVTAATTSNITTFPPTDGISTVTTLDGVTLTIGDRILIKDQTDLIQNGIYIITSTAWERAADLSIGSTSIGSTVKVNNGDKYALSTYNGTSGVLVGTDQLVFEQSSAGSGVSWKQSVKLATTTEITPFPPTDGISTVTTIDGVALTIGDRILIKDQTNLIHNGIYVITSTTWERASDFNTDAIVSGSAMWVNEGSTYGDQGWVCVSDSATVDTSNLIFDIMSAETLPGGSNTFIQFNNGTSFAGSADLTWDGTTVAVNGGLSLQDSGTNTVTLVAPTTVTSPYVITLPPVIGTAGQVLSTDGSGITSWETAANLSGSSDQNILFDNAGSIGGSADLTWDGTSLKVAYNKNITVGTGNDLAFSHNGTDSSITSTTGALNIVNSSTTTDTVLKLGDTVGTTNVLITDSTDTTVLSVTSKGALTTNKIEQTSNDFYVASTATGIIDAQGLTLHGDYIYVASPSVDRVYIYKTDPLSDNVPTLIGSITDSTNLDTVTNVIHNGNTVFVGGSASSNTGGFVTSIDMTDPAFPLIISKETHNSVTGVSKMTQIGGAHVILGSVAGSSCIVFNVADPLNMIGQRLETATQTGVYGIEVVDDKLYLCADSLLTVLKITYTNTIDAIPVDNYSVPGLTSARALKVKGNYAYIGSYNAVSGANGITVVDISKPKDMVKVGTTYTGDPTDTLGLISDIAISGKYLYVIAEENGDLQRIDISDPTALVGAGRITGFSDPTSLEISGSYLYVTNRSANTVTKVNIGAAQLPQLLCGDIRSTTSIVENNSTVHGNLNVGSGISVRGSITSQGPISTSGAFSIKGSAHFYGTAATFIDVTAPATVTSHTLTLPGTVGTAGTVLTDTAGNGVLTWAASAPSTLQETYDTGTGIILSSTFEIQDNPTPLGTNLLEVNDNTNTPVFGVSTSGATHTGTITATTFTDGTAVITSGDISGVTDLALTGIIKLRETTSTSPTETVSIAAPDSITTSYTLSLPSSAGTSAQVLSTDGSGSTSWISPMDLSGSSDSQLLFNNSGTLSGSPDITWDGTLLKTRKFEQTSTDFYVASVSSDFPITQAKGIVAHGDYIYITGVSADSVYIYKTDHTNDNTPTLVGSITDSTFLENPEKIIFNGTHLFVGGTIASNGNGYLTAIDIADPTTPVILGHKNDSNLDTLAEMCQFGGKYIVLAEYSGASTLQIDISDPNYIFSVSLYGSGLEKTYGIDCIGDKVYFAGTDPTNSNYGGISVLKMTHAIGGHQLNLYGNIFSDSSIQNPGKIKIQGNYGYIASATSGNGIHVIDISDPYAMFKVSSFSTDLGKIEDMVISGKYLYVVGEDNNNLYRVDISDPTNLVSAGTLAGFNSPRGLSISGGYLYVTNFTGNYITKVNIGSAQIPQLSSGHIETTDIAVMKDATIRGQLSIGSGISIGASVVAQGQIVSNAALITKGSLLFYEPDGGSAYVGMIAPTTISSYTLTLPSSAGTSSQILSTDGSGVLSWVDNTVPTAKGSVTQSTTVNTSVDINSKAGKITTVSLVVPSHSTESFNVTNTECLADSIVLCNVISYNGNFNLHCGVTNVSSGSFEVVLTNSTGGPLNGVAIIGFLIV